MKKITSQYLRPFLASTYGKFWAKNATFEVSTFRNLNTPDFDLLPDLDLTRDLNFKIFESALGASRRDLSNAASPISLQPS